MPVAPPVVPVVSRLTRILLCLLVVPVRVSKRGCARVLPVKPSNHACCATAYLVAVASSTNFTTTSVASVHSLI